jgi:hypothetical protein
MSFRKPLFLGHTFFCPRCGSEYEFLGAGHGPGPWNLKGLRCLNCQGRLLFSSYALLLVSVLAFCGAFWFAKNFETLLNWPSVLLSLVFSYFFGFSMRRAVQQLKLKRQQTKTDKADM